jgi:hypothetical protein
MSDGLNKLKSIGAQKIHEKTHIARHHVQAVIHETFDDMTKIQLLGFISILEREYSVDLSDLKIKVQDFFSVTIAEDEQNAKVFVSPKKEKKLHDGLYNCSSANIWCCCVIHTRFNTWSI